MAVQVRASAGVTGADDVRMIASPDDSTALIFPFAIDFGDVESVDHVMVSLSREAANALLVKLANALHREVHDAQQCFPF